MKENSIKDRIDNVYCFKNSIHSDFRTGLYYKEELENLDYILSDYKRVLKINEVLLKENEELKNSLSWRINYCQELEKDLFENCENFVISKDKIKEQIKKYATLSDDFYEKWKNSSPVDGDYKNIRNKGMCCDAIINVLQELLKG